MSGVLLGIVNGAWGATAWVPVGLSPLFTYLGAMWNNQSLMTMATTVTQPMYYGSLAVLVTVGFAVLLIVGGMRKYFFVQNVLCITSIISQLVIIGVLAFTDRNTFTQAFNSFLATFSLGHNQILSTAQSLGWASPAAVSLALAFQAGPVVYGSMFWVEFSTSLGGEIKQVRRSQLIGIVGCLLFWTILTYATFFLMVNMVGYEFISAHDYLINGTPRGSGITTSSTTISSLRDGCWKKPNTGDARCHRPYSRYNSDRIMGANPILQKHFLNVLRQNSTIIPSGR